MEARSSQARNALCRSGSAASYKARNPTLARNLRLTCNDFGCEIQLSAQIALINRWRIYEVGISYFGRTYEEGKKIGWRDGVKAVWYLVRFRLFS